MASEPVQVAEDVRVRRLEEAVLYLAEFAEEQGLDLGLAAEDGFDYGLVLELRAARNDGCQEGRTDV